ncbi:hypothetical protein RhiirA4_479857 [Rhizophagus irregularis]|uniref:DNA primase/nucleoside triphosphatase C-terminal domain-containing protein n=1 Tax=Rhizophagus irregularis TaxID=588596 RepID=A0A2I1HH19_9GLOM|nr:hypothetical protein RhiirA4_479857 [Rhizophagus irregularis]
MAFKYGFCNLHVNKCHSKANYHQKKLDKIFQDWQTSEALGEALDRMKMLNAINYVSLWPEDVFCKQICCATLYQDYLTWCDKNNEQALSSNSFGKKFLQMDINRKRVRVLGNSNREWQYILDRSKIISKGYIDQISAIYLHLHFEFSDLTLSIIFWHPSWPETGKLIEILRFSASFMTALGYYQVATIVPAWILQITCPKDQPELCHSNQISVKDKHSNIESNIQSGHVNDSETRRKAWYLDYIVVVRLNGGW